MHDSKSIRYIHITKKIFSFDFSQTGELYLDQFGFNSVIEKVCRKNLSIKVTL